MFLLQNKKNKIKQNSGLTILEFIIYFAITLVMLAIIVQISINIFSGRERIKAHQELNRSGQNAMNAIVDAILDADEFVGAGSFDD
ncbi:MAG TPA: hypothetical protein PJ997_00300 [Candidatus Paceibacterota bacterium]|nr:hypothetical protein [Candidatus Paceibacterota bacterium]HMP18772.1 hypothetical protein [Candidatus Paceibacterota bacterium]HMP85330.1 hypothetical protein [Candidatus Paceibacterota bacterium]